MALPTPAPLNEIKAFVSRVEKILIPLEKEYQECLGNKVVSFEARALTHEVIEKCSNALDQLMYALWYQRVRPLLSSLPSRGGYFPAANSENDYKSCLGQWNCSDLGELDPDLDSKLRQTQPFYNSANIWIWHLKELARAKHTGLKPQKTVEEKRVNVTRAGSGGGVSWGPGVRFGSGVAVMGAPIDPITQLPIPTPGVVTTIEHWVSFIIEGTTLNALAFCRTIAEKTAQIVNELTAS